ncbi:hypothetical protein CRYUN_Cryun19dG0079700 [Craigia yunnanensis]
MIVNLFNPMLVVLTLCIEIALFCPCQNSSFSCIEGERQTLLKLKQSFEDPFHRLSSWKGNNCCIWKGVSCDETNGHVVKLNLRAPSRFSNKSFYGIISEEISFLVAPVVKSCLLELRYLEHLDLSGNDFQYSPIPQFFSSMKQLRYLNISNARFNGSVPNYLGNLTGLRVLDLSSNGQGPLWADDVKWISSLVSLQHLGTVPSMIQNMTSLRILDLSFNLFTSSIQTSFGNFENLVHLNLAANDFSGIEKGLLLILGNMCHLKSLDMSDNQLQGEEIGNYRNLSGCFGHDLETLNLDYARISGRIPDWVGMLENLKYLHLSDNQFNGTIPESCPKVLGNFPTSRL